MATISLRAYYSEIEGMIERGRTKDAIIHCRQILKSYPKSIDTYRLLGKAYLEAQRFSEGADVLQRVLSAVPDDFVSQIGLSIIREDEGNLDGALWHMERAFEAQPSNKAVQDELRRLYGRRDGVQPTKIRLTRGALVRMYARGDLYQQAIAEARMALVEQPDRVDIELILARMYYLSNQKISATEICSRILAKLPFCYEANKILTEILPGTSRQDEVEIYKRRLFDLDPYFEFAPPGALSSAEALDESILLEALEFDEAKLAAEHPELAGDEEERLPEWLAALESKEAPSDEISQIMDKGLKVSGLAEGLVKFPQPAEPVPTEESQIPEWMKEAGWQPAEEGKEETESISEEVADEIASEAEIPEWLQSLAPTEETPGIFGTADSTDEEENTAWLESILEGEVSGDQILEESETVVEAEAEPIQEEIETTEINPAAVEEAHPLETLAEEFETEEVEPEPVDLENVADLLSSEAAKENIPEWLAGMAAMEPEPEEIEPVEQVAPDNEWLKSLADEAETHPEEELSRAEGGQPVEFAAEQPEMVEGEDAEEIKIDTDWLKRMPFEEEAPTEVEPSVEEGVQPFEIEPELSEEVEKEEGIGETEEIKIDTDWLQRIAPEEEPAAEAEPVFEHEIQPEEFEPERPSGEIESGDEFKITTDWLRSLPEEKEEELPLESVAPAEEEAEPVEFETGEEAEPEKYAADEDFLKRLAQEVEAEAEPGIESIEEQSFEAGITPPEEGKEEIEEYTASADWLKRLSTEGEEPVEPEPEGVEEKPLVAEPALEQTEETGEELGLPEKAAEPALEQPEATIENLEFSEEGAEPTLEQPEETIEELEIPQEVAEPAIEQPAQLIEELEVAEEAGTEEIPFEEAAPAEPMSSEEFLSEIEQALPPEKEATQPTRVNPPPVGGIPIEEFIAQLEAEEKEATEPQEITAETSLVEEEQPAEEIELTAAELEGILPEVTADNNFDQTSGVGIPDWLKESLDIEEVETQTGAAEEILSLEGIPGIFPEKSPEELALEEILAAPEELSPEEAAAIEEEGAAPAWSEPEEEEKLEEIEPVSPFEELEEIPEELSEITSPTEIEVTEEEVPTLESEEGKELLGWLAEDFEETEQELAKEAEFLPPELEKSEWVAEETLIQPAEIAESVEEEITLEQAAEPIEPEEVPDWLMALAEEKEPQPEGPEVKEEAIPEWLKDLEEEPSIEEQPSEEPSLLQSEEMAVEGLEEEPEVIFEAEEAVESLEELETSHETEEIDEAQEVPQMSLETEEAQGEPTVEETSPVQVTQPPAETIAMPSSGSDLYNAQASMNAHDLETALSYYNQLIGRGEALEDTIHDLREALYHYPVDISIWQALGDAYMRNNQLQDALDAYTKAEELMR